MLKDAKEENATIRETLKTVQEEHKTFQAKTEQALEAAAEEMANTKLLLETVLAAVKDQPTTTASSAPAKRLAQQGSASSVAATGNETMRLQAELYQMQRQLHNAEKAAPQPGPHITAFRKEKFRAAWAMLLTIFPSTVAKELNGYAATATKELTRILEELLRPLLFNQEHWHKDVRGTCWHCHSLFFGFFFVGGTNVW